MNYFPVPAVNTDQWHKWWASRFETGPSLSLVRRDALASKPGSKASKVKSVLLDRAPDYVTVNELFAAAYDCSDSGPRTKDTARSVSDLVGLLRRQGTRISHYVGRGYRIAQAGDPETKLPQAEPPLLAAIKAAGDAGVSFEDIAAGRSREWFRHKIKWLREYLRLNGGGSLESIREEAKFYDANGRICTRYQTTAVRFVEARQ